MRFRDTVRPLLLAPLGAMGVHGVGSALSMKLSPNDYVMLWIVGLASFIAGVLFVLPVLAFVPRLRQPSVWIAMLWGALVAWCAAGLTTPIDSGFRELYRWEVAAPFGAAGAASGLVYAIAARRMYPNAVEGARASR